MIFTLLKDIAPESGEAKASMVVTTPKPRLVKLAISAQGEDMFVVGGATSARLRITVVKIELGGITGLVARIFGKQPPDIHVWVLRGEAPGALSISNNGLLMIIIG